MQDKMIGVCKEFYQSLGIPYRVVNIARARSTTRPPRSTTWRGSRLQGAPRAVSCSNCTDFRPRRLEVRYGQQKDKDGKVYAHMLNPTLIATERAMCRVLENYQTKEGIKAPRSPPPRPPPPRRACRRRPCRRASRALLRQPGAARVHGRRALHPVYRAREAQEGAGAAAVRAVCGEARRARRGASRCRRTWTRSCPRSTST